MSLVSWIELSIKISIALTVLSLGLRTSQAEATSLIRRPGLLLRSLVSMNIVMPLIAVALSLSFDLPPAVKLALCALSVSPMPPFLPRSELKAGGESAYIFGLLVADCALAVILIPLSFVLMGRVFGFSLHVPAVPVARVVLTTVLAPLATGIFLHRIAPAFAGRIAKPLGTASMALLILCFLPILLTQIPAIVSLIGNGTLLAMTVFVIAGFTVGHLLGGPGMETRKVLALSTASRHPGVALAITHITFPELKLAVAAVLLYVIVSAILAKPYLAVSSHRSGGVSVPPARPKPFGVS